MLSHNWPSLGFHNFNVIFFLKGPLACLLWLILEPFREEQKTSAKLLLSIMHSTQETEHCTTLSKTYTGFKCHPSAHTFIQDVFNSFFFKLHG